MSPAIHPDIELGEVKLKVSNLKRSLLFYTEVIGFHVLSQSDHTAELAVAGDTAPLLVLEHIPNAVITPPRSHSGLYHFAILLPTRADLGVSLRRLIDAGIQIGQADHLVSEALYISDPDHNGIEIYRDRPRETWKRNEQSEIVMTTDPIDWDGLLHEGSTKKWAGLPHGTKMGHVHLHVGDLQRSRQFYCDILGFDVVFDVARQMRALFISAGGYHHHLGLNVWAGVGAPQPSPSATGLAYYTIVFPDAAALQSVLDQLESAGISTIQEQGQAWFVTDPSGISLKLCTKG